MDGLTPDPFEGMHLPLPFHPVTNLNNDNVKSSCLDFRRHISSLVHFANYLYPVRGSVVVIVVVVLVVVIVVVGLVVELVRVVVVVIAVVVTMRRFFPPLTEQPLHMSIIFYLHGQYTHSCINVLCTYQAFSFIICITFYLHGHVQCLHVDVYTMLLNYMYTCTFYCFRYKKLCEDHSEFLKVWPGYVFWARGHVKLALSAFTIALDTLKHGKWVHDT